MKTRLSFYKVPACYFCKAKATKADRFGYFWCSTWCYITAFRMGV